MLEACRSVVAATLFYGTDLYHYVSKSNGKYGAQLNIRGIHIHTPAVASSELAAALTTTALEAHDRRPLSLTHVRARRLVPAQEYHKLAAAAGLEKPTCKGLNLGLSVHVERDLVIKVTICVRLPTRLTVCRAGPVHCYPHIVLLLTPRVVSFLSPALIRSSQSNPTTCFSLLFLEL